MIECYVTKYSMETKLESNKDAKGKAVNPTQYEGLVGGLKYLVTCADIAYAVGIVSRCM